MTTKKAKKSGFRIRIVEGKPYTRAERVAANNEWMRRYTEQPERFEATFRTAMNFLLEQAEGTTPTRGETCETYLESLMAEARSNPTRPARNALDIADSIANGLSLEAAASAALMSMSELREWMRRSPDLRRKVKLARDVFESKQRVARRHS